MKAIDKLKQLQAKLIKELNTIDASEYFSKIPEIIRKRSRSGIGLSSTDGDGSKQKFKKLAPSTIKRRQSLERKGELSSETSPATSNITESGKTLDSIRFRKSGKRYEIFFDARRTRNGVKPAEIREYLEDGGRLFFALSKDEREKLEANVAKKINEVIKKTFQ